LLKFEIFSSIQPFNRSICTHDEKCNPSTYIASVWWWWGTPYIHCNLFISFNYSIDQRFSCARGRAVVAEEEEEEAGIEEAVEEIDSSSVDGGVESSGD
jgi:hypothetical protein